MPTNKPEKQLHEINMKIKVTFGHLVTTFSPQQTAVL